MFAVMFVAAQFGVIYTALVAIILKRQKINRIFQSLAIIYDNGEFLWDEIADDIKFIRHSASFREKKH